MNRKTIFKMLAAAMLMPTMLLTTACSNSDDEIINTENPTNTKGYALPVTINVTRQGDDATTRATFDGSKLSFSTGDKLFVQGSYNEGECTYAGMLDYVSDGTFSGTIMTQTKWTGTIEELLSEDGGANATLLPAGYGEYGYLSIADEGTYEAYLIENYNKAFATSKATAVEQFSYEYDNSYSSSFELIPVNAILNFTINGLDASTEVDVSFSYPNYPEDIVVSRKVTTDGDGTATFAIGMIYGNNLKDCTLTVDGNAITLPADKEVEAGKIYNVNRSVTPAATARTLAEATAEDLGKIAGADGNIYDSKDAASTAGTTAVAMIAYVGSGTEHATYTHGLAIALADESSSNWSTAKSTCEGKAAVTNAAWLLPSQNQWKAMFKAFGDNEDSYSGLNAALAAAGGDSSKLQENGDGDYWSSSGGGASAYIVGLKEKGVAHWLLTIIPITGDVRACLAF